MLSNFLSEKNVTVIQKEPLEFTQNDNTYFIIALQLNGSSLLMFGLDVTLTVSPKPGSGLSPEEVACAVVFVSHDSQIVLASNVVR